MGSLPYNLDPNKGPVGQCRGEEEGVIYIIVFQVLERIPSLRSTGDTLSSLTIWSPHGNVIISSTQSFFWLRHDEPFYIVFSLAVWESPCSLQ